MFIFEQTHRQNSINARGAICRGCRINLFVGHNQMTDNPRTSNRSTDQQQALVSIYWDYQNIPYVKQAKNLLLFATSLGYVVTRKVYDKNWQQENKGSQKRHRTFVNLGFECVEVFQKIDDAVDFSLVFDCSGEAAISLYPHTFIIVSGDGNGEILIPKLQNKGKKVIILARPGNENKNLARLANEFYFVNELPKLLESYKLAA